MTDSTIRPEDERLPVPTLFGYGVQHILSMFGGVIAVPIIVGNAAGLSGPEIGTLLACALFVSGAATLLQTLGLPFFGSQLPLVQGISFASVATMLSIIGDDGKDGLQNVFGAVIVAALIGLAISPFFSQIIRFFPPVVTGSIITVIGLSLMPVAAGWITGQPELGGEPNPAYLDPGNIGLAFLTFALRARADEGPDALAAVDPARAGAGHDRRADRRQGVLRRRRRRVGRSRSRSRSRSAARRSRSARSSR